MTTDGCAYGRLIVGIAALRGVIPGEPVRPCDQPVQYYVRVVQGVADQYEVEHLVKVCARHEAPAGRLDGHQQSRFIRPRRPAPVT